MGGEDLAVAGTEFHPGVRCLGCRRTRSARRRSRGVSALGLDGPPSLRHNRGVFLSASEQGGRVKRRAVYPGTFDPPTYGHIDIIRRSLQIVDEIVVAVVYNPQKDSFLFTGQERIEMFRQELA